MEMTAIQRPANKRTQGMQNQMELQNIDRQMKIRILDIRPMNVVKLLLRGKGRAVIHYSKTQNMENILSKLLTQIIIKAH